MLLHQIFVPGCTLLIDSLHADFFHSYFMRMK